MIRLIAQGGLGNQLFVWNYAHKLNIEYGVKVIIVFSEEVIKDRDIFLNSISEYCSHDIDINISGKYHSLLRALDLAGSKLPKLIRQFSQRVGIHSLATDQTSLISGKHPLFLIRGYFQDSKCVLNYYKVYCDEIESWLGKTVSNATKKLVREKGLYNAVHARRGDFEDSRLTTGVLSNDYFVSLIDSTYNTIVVTDDEHAILGLSKSFPTSLVLGPKETPPPDSLYILSRAHRLITSNSTFSWWAAVIGSQNIHTVFLPKPWNKKQFNGPEYLNLPFATYVKSFFVK